MCLLRIFQNVYLRCGHMESQPPEEIRCGSIHCKFSPNHRTGCVPPSCERTCIQLHSSPQHCILNKDGFCSSCTRSMTGRRHSIKSSSSVPGEVPQDDVTESATDTEQSSTLFSSGSKSRNVDDGSEGQHSFVYRNQHSSFTSEDLEYGEANLGLGGCLISVHEPKGASLWIENNWDSGLFTSLRSSGCAGPYACMLSPAEPALAMFGWDNDPVVVNMAHMLSEASGLPVVVRPPHDNPALTLLVPAMPIQSGNTGASGDRGSDADDEGESVHQNVGPFQGAGYARQRDSGRQNMEFDDPQILNAAHKQPQGFRDGGGNRPGDDGGGVGPASTDSKWDSPLHRTRIKLRFKLANGQAYAVTIGYNFTFIINRETKIPINLEDLTRPLSQPEAIALVDFKIETRLRETQLDRSYASIGFVAHRHESIIEREFLHRGCDLPDKIYKHGEVRQIQRGFKGALGFSQGTPLATAAVSYNQNNDTILEATDNKVMPRCCVDYEPGDEWDEGHKSYSSYNIAFQRQDMRLEADRPEHPLEVKVGMGINLRPSGLKQPLPQISFVNRNQVLIWVLDPMSRAQIRGIVVLMSNYLDNVRTEDALEIYEQEEINLCGGKVNTAQRKAEAQKLGTISLSIAQVQKERASGPNKFAAGLIPKLGRTSTRSATCIPPQEYLARGWDASNNEWRGVLWPALDKHSRAAVYERTPPVSTIQCQWKQAATTRV
ncbi:hypothetical protein B0H12DRAFT_783486 [Mycena haematopus]|nr:hypothetical protein B0H12DRAFT_783486 [Mycena haematopus]